MRREAEEPPLDPQELINMRWHAACLESPEMLRCK